MAENINGLVIVSVIVIRCFTNGTLSTVVGQQQTVLLLKLLMMMNPGNRPDIPKISALFAEPS